MTTISSRTPEGAWNHCPLCCAEVCIEPSQPAGDAPCPNCGHLLWFIRWGGEVRCYDADVMSPDKRRALEALRSYLVDNLGLSPDASISPQDELGLDSLDIVELVMELEEEFEITIPDYEAEKIKTIGDAINFIKGFRR